VGTKIEWVRSPDGSAGETWNPVTGCTPISSGCTHCYAKRLAEGRLRGRFGYDANEPFKVTVHNDKWLQPFEWKKPKSVFVCSMGDLFHQDVPDWVINKIMVDCANWAYHGHVFFFLTKRPERMVQFFSELVPHPNIYLGVTVENELLMPRIDTLLHLSVKWKKFVSVEPMLGPVPIPMDVIGKLDWVICGGEKGKKARECNAFWMMDLLSRCVAQRANYFFKQPGDNFKGSIDDLIYLAKHRAMPWDRA